MNKTNCRIIFVLIALITACFYGEALAVQFDFKAPKELGQDELNKMSGSANKGAIRRLIVRPKVKYSAQGLRDPFRPAIEKKVEGQEAKEYTEKPFPALAVQGITWGGIYPQAIINNKVVKKGDLIEGAEVKDITKDGVTLIFEQIEHKLSSPAATGPQREAKNNDTPR